jgi:murein DD-endopeptidase MepM/ murein hydrolase activator NlpD
MYAIRMFLKTAFTPLTILLVPHSRSRTRAIRLPLAGIVALLALSLAGTASVIFFSARAVEYIRMRDRLGEVTARFLELKSTMNSLKRAESDFRRLFALKTKTEVLESVGEPGAGSLDTDAIREEVIQTAAMVTEIRAFLASQRDLYRATPRGMPVDGRLSSPYGYRNHPRTGDRRFHGGVDLSASLGSAVRATADGIVSFSGWTLESGNAVVVEHGNDFTTVYCHNQKNTVRVGQKVARGDLVAMAGSTGTSTGPHVHYEVWRGGRHVDPAPYLERR